MGWLGGAHRRRREGQGSRATAAKTDKIDAWVLAELTRPALVPAIWLPDPSVRAERERARFRLHRRTRRSRMRRGLFRL
jgi:hypothetical protein